MDITFELTRDVIRSAVNKSLDVTLHNSVVDSALHNDVVRGLLDSYIFGVIANNPVTPYYMFAFSFAATLARLTLKSTKTSKFSGSLSAGTSAIEYLKAVCYKPLATTTELIGLTTLSLTTMRSAYGFVSDPGKGRSAAPSAKKIMNRVSYAAFGVGTIATVAIQSLLKDNPDSISILKTAAESLLLIGGNAAGCFADTQCGGEEKEKRQRAFMVVGLFYGMYSIWTTNKSLAAKSIAEILVGAWKDSTTQGMKAAMKTAALQVCRSFNPYRKPVAAALVSPTAHEPPRPSAQSPKASQATAVAHS